MNKVLIFTAPKNQGPLSSCFKRPMHAVHQGKQLDSYDSYKHPAVLVLILASTTAKATLVGYNIFLIHRRDPHLAGDVDP